MAATWTKVPGTHAFSSVQATTEAAPSGSTEGVDLWGFGGFDLYVSCDEGETFGVVGAGALLGYRYSDVTGAWARAPDIDLDMPAEADGVRRIASTGWQVGNPRGRVAHIASGVVVSGGGLTLVYELTELSGRKG